MSLTTEIIYTERKPKSLPAMSSKCCFVIWFICDSLYSVSVSPTGKASDGSTAKPLQSSQWRKSKSCSSKTSWRGCMGVTPRKEPQNEKLPAPKALKHRLTFLWTLNVSLLLGFWTPTSSAWNALSYSTRFYLNNSYSLFKAKVKFNSSTEFFPNSLGWALYHSSVLLQCGFFSIPTNN